MSKPTLKSNGHDRMTESVHLLLGRVVEELVNIAGTVEETQSTITRLTWRQASQNSEYSEAMQKADLISQELSGLASFIEKLAEALPEHLRVDATQARGSIRLSDLARRLAA